MERKVGLSFFLISITFVVCLVLNFPDSLMGNPATFKNAVVTILYIAIWIFVLSLASRYRSRLLLKYYSVFWLMTLFFAVLTVLVNLEIFNAIWATLFVALLITQWYGIELFVNDFLITAIIISSISLLFLFASLLSLRKARSI
ncbi:hypothetical protein [Planococcus sp. CAU13]|uniref:hypothetical protein n=1 Tax=Planococcus sp. CAU13 TaxID=1541197 RepID=UPI0005300769|nr:hypothetical protein [Planococcus sp. CAU13]